MGRLILGDCLEKMKSIPDGGIDMVLADPPYGTTACKWDSIIPLEPMWKELKRVTKKGGAIVLTSSQPFTTTLISSNIDMFKYCLVWEKSRATGHLNANRMPMRAHEDVVVFYRKLPTYNPQKTQDHKPMNAATRNGNGECYGKSNNITYGGATDRHPRSVIKINSINNASEGKHHPTQKPVALMEYLIKTYTNEGETVLDFTTGSGTTGVACVNTGRDFIGIEMDKGYFDIAVNRIKEAKGEIEDVNSK